MRHILHSNTLAGVLFDVLLEIVLLHLQIADEAVMDGYALDTVLSLALNFGDIYTADEFLEQRRGQGIHIHKAANSFDKEIIVLLGGLQLLEFGFKACDALLEFKPFGLVFHGHMIEPFVRYLSYGVVLIEFLIKIADRLLPLLRFAEFFRKYRLLRFGFLLRFLGKKFCEGLFVRIEESRQPSEFEPYYLVKRIFTDMIPLPTY